MLPSLNALQLSEGERSILVSHVGLALIGAWIAYVVSHRLAGYQSLIDVPTLFDIWSLFAGAIGAVSAVHLSRHLLGQSGWRGLYKVGIGLFSISFVAALIGGTLVLPLFGTMFGPLALVGTFLDQPLLLLIWVATLFGANLAYGVHRRERDTFFSDRLI